MAKPTRSRARGKSLNSKPTKAEKASVAAEIKKIRDRAAREIQQARDRIARDAKKERERAEKQKERDRAAREKFRRELEKERARAAKTFKGWGFLPRAKSPKYIRRRTKSLAEQFADFLNPQKMTFVPAKSKRAKSKLLPTAKQLGYRATPKGFFFPREGAKKIRTEYDKKSDRYTIVQERIEKKGTKGKGKTITRRHPIKPITDTDETIQELRDQAREFGRLKKNERLAFTVESAHGGMSRRTYSNMSLLIADLEKRYDKSKNAPDALRGKRRSQFTDFLELITVQKTTVKEWSDQQAKWDEEMRVFMKRRGNRGKPRSLR